MSDMKKLTIGSTEYTVVDQTARNSISNLATVATTGSYTDLSNTPSSANTNISDEYDSTKTYNSGDVVIYNSVLYICDGTSVTGDWDSTKWIHTTVKQLLSLKADSSTTYTKTEVDSALSLKASASDVSTLTNNLSGFKFSMVDLEYGKSTVCTYSFCALAVIGRGGAGIYFAHWSGVNTIVAASNHTATQGGNNPYTLTIANNAQVTDRILFIYQ